jgi:hypothetical protein
LTPVGGIALWLPPALVKQNKAPNHNEGDEGVETKYPVNEEDDDEDL